jgi:hypothetical protein
MSTVTQARAFNVAALNITPTSIVSGQSPYTPNTRESVLLCDTSTGPITITPVQENGRKLYIKDSGNAAGTSAITITPTTGQIEFGASLVLNTNGDHAHIISDGTNFYTIG